MLSKVTRYILFVLIFLTPLFFWTLTPNFFATAKESLLLYSVAILTIIYGINIFRTRSLSLPNSSLTFPLLAFFLAIVINLVFNFEGRPEAISGKGATLLILPILSLFLLSQKSQTKLVHNTKLALILSSIVLAIHSLLQLTFLHTISSLPLYMQSTAFTLTGSYVTTLSILIISAGLAIGEIKHNNINKQLLFTALLINAVAAIAIISLMFPGGSLTLNLIPYIETWAIALDALKSARSLFIGVGLANFSLLYTSVKPLSLNLTPLWNVVPQSGSSELLTMLATTGLTGTITLGYLMVKGALSKATSPLTIPLILSILAIVLTPSSLPIYLIFFTLLALNSHVDPTIIPLSSSASKILGIAVIVTVLGLTTLQTKPLISEYFMRQAQLALIENDGKRVYESHITALKYNPKMTNYHLSLADVNMNIASALSQKKELTDADRTNISTLVQQSIKEAKTAISIRPNNATGWLSLAKIYRNLIGIAEGSDQFAIQSYSQAVALDPANPSLRVEFGGLYYQLALAQKTPAERNAQLARAVQEFQVAIKLKKDYANAYYNLAKSLELAENYAEAVISMQQVVAFTDPASDDYPKAVSELETLRAKVPKAGQTTQPEATEPKEEQDTTLSTPSPLPEPIEGGPIEISE